MPYRDYEMRKLKARERRAKARRGEKTPSPFVNVVRRDRPRSDAPPPPEPDRNIKVTLPQINFISLEQIREKYGNDP